MNQDPPPMQPSAPAAISHPPIEPPPPDIEAGYQAVVAPGITLMVIGILNVCLFVLSGLVQVITAVTGPNNDEVLIIVIIQLVIVGVGLIAQGVVIHGANQMRQARSLGFAWAAVVLSMLPIVTACCLPGIGVGIWAIVVLMRPDVQAAFAEGGRDLT